jgi:Uncharacterized conserved protein (DUF2190)
MANECIPLFRPGVDVTCQTSAAVQGKRFVNISANRDATTGLFVVGPCAAAAKAFGVAAYDAPINSRVPVIRGTKSIVPVTAGGTIAFGAQVEVDASQRAVTLAGTVPVGRALEAGTVGNDILIELY